jgi:hypothetical protein
MVKGMWAGIPYNRTLNGTTTTSNYETAASGQYTFAKGDNVTFKPGMGIGAKFANLNATGQMTANSTKIMYNADSFTQGGVALDAAAAKAASQVLATVYQQAGIDENATELTTAQQENLAKAIAATEAAYAADPGKYSLATTTLANSFSSVYNDLLVDYMGPTGVTAANGSAITAAVATGMVAGYASNLTNVQTEQQKIIDKAAANAKLVNSPAPADLVNAKVVATLSNNTLADVLSFGGTAQSYFVNGTILQTAATGGDSFAFLDGDYTENATVYNQTDSISYMATLLPSNIQSNITATTAFNITVDGKTFQFHTDASNKTYGWYNVSNMHGAWYMPMTKSGEDNNGQLIVMANKTSAGNISSAAAAAYADGSTDQKKGNDTTGARTIGFKNNIDESGRPFIAYYWNKAVKIYNDWASESDSFNGYGKAAWGSANATFNGATVDKAATFSK